jgi:lipoprotein-anchoring transpeptidase ErfK/SrfK
MVVRKGVAKLLCLAVWLQVATIAVYAAGPFNLPFSLPFHWFNAPPAVHRTAPSNQPGHIVRPRQSTQNPATSPQTHAPKQDNSAAAPSVSHEKTSGSFINNHFVIGKSLHKNGFHKGFPIVIVVDKGAHFTYVFQKQQNDKVVEVLRASNAVGSDDTPTPYGPYKVADKLKWPSWIPPKSIDPKQKAIPPYNKTHKNPLGVARITLNKFGISLHGTNDPKSLRKNVSHGCIRHSNQDIVKMFNMVEVGDTVLIVPKLAGTVIDKSDFYNKRRVHEQEAHKAKH